MVFFDVGRTLVREVVDAAEATLATLADLGAGGGADEVGAAMAAMRHAYHAGCYAPATLAGERRLWRTMAEVALSRLPAGPRPALVRRLAASFERYPERYGAVPGMLDLVADLRAEGRRLGIVSNWPPSLAAVLRRTGFGAFDVVACSGRLRCAKPDPAIFRWALRRARIGAARTWFVGDNPETDYRPAEAVGMRAVLWDPAARGPAGLRRVGNVTELRAVLGVKS